MKKIKKTAAWLVAVLVFAVAVFCMLYNFPQKAMVEFENGEVKMIAHRGLSVLHTENSRTAFIGAGKTDCYGIETDVHVTKDGQFVLFHDSNLLKKAGVDMEIAETDYATLKTVVLSDKGGDGKDGTEIPTFDEYVKICKQYQKRAIVELKAGFTKAQIEGIVSILDENEMKENASFISFKRQNLLFLREVLPNAHAQYLIETVTADELQFALDNGFDASIQFWRVLPSMVKKMHEAGLKVGCWTVDKLWQASLMKTYGVDYITSNILV